MDHHGRVAETSSDETERSDHTAQEAAMTGPAGLRPQCLQYALIAQWAPERSLLLLGDGKCYGRQGAAPRRVHSDVLRPPLYIGHNRPRPHFLKTHSGRLSVRLLSFLQGPSSSKYVTSMAAERERERGGGSGITRVVTVPPPSLRHRPSEQK